MDSQNLELLLEEHSAAKARMRRGIILLVIGAVVEILAVVFNVVGMYLWPLLILAILLYLVCLALFAFGMVFLISGIIRRAKANTKITNAKNAAE